MNIVKIIRHIISRKGKLTNSLLSNNRSGVGRQSVVPLRFTTASPPTLMIPLQSGKTADILRCRSGVHRLAFRLPHCLGRIHGLRLPVASVNDNREFQCRAYVRNLEGGLQRRLKSAKRTSDSLQGQKSLLEVDPRAWMEDVLLRITDCRNDRAALRERLPDR